MAALPQTFRSSQSGENRQAFDSARTIVPERYREIGFHPAELLRRLGIEADLAVYTALDD
jgi:hypothetical protein